MQRKPLLSVLLSFAVLIQALVSSSISAAPGDLYVVEGDARSVFTYTPAGTKGTFASGLYQPTALAFDNQGNLFVADSGACSGVCPPTIIYRFTPAGVRSVFASGGIYEPLGMAFDSSGNLFVSDNGFAIYKFRPDGSRSTFASGLPGVWAMAFDSSGNLFGAADANGHPGLILKFAPDGSRSTFASFEGSPAGLAFDIDGNLFSQDDINGTIRKITPAGTVSTFGSAGAGQSLAFDAQRNLFAAAVTTDGTIYKFTPAGIRSTFTSGAFTNKWSMAFEPVVEKLRNASTRAFVGTGDNVMIGGFILGGNALGNNAVLVRAIGPSLSQSGVANALTDPVLELYNSSGALVARNDNWQDTQAGQISGTGLAPTDAREAAIYATLPAGNFTAIVRGAGGATGVALVEVYSLR